MDRLPLAVAALAFCAPAIPAQWQSLATPSSPTARHSMAMAADAGGNVLLFGGTTGISSGPNSTVTLKDNQTWRFDQTTWTLLSPATKPTSRYAARMVFDSARGRFVLYGGMSSSGTFSSANDETWEFDGTTWTQATPTNGPGARCRYGLAFDLASSRTVLFGGSANVISNSGLDDLWEYDGSDWQQVATSNSPGRRERPAMCGHVALGGVVLFGGRGAAAGGNQLIADDRTWLYVSGSGSWVDLTAPGPRPAPRLGARMVYDPHRDVAVMFGGMDPGTGDSRNDTWQLDATGTWTQLPDASTPARDMGLAFDSVRRQIVRFGGAPTVFGYGDETSTFGADAALSGGGCPGVAGIPVLLPVSLPRIGTSFQLNLSVIPPTSTAAVFVYGLTDGGNTPLDPIGMPGCVARTSPDLLVLEPAGFGLSASSLPIPMFLPLVGTELFAQALAFELGANPLGLTASNGATGLIGL